MILRNTDPFRNTGGGPSRPLDPPLFRTIVTVVGRRVVGPDLVVSPPGILRADGSPQAPHHTRVQTPPCQTQGSQTSPGESGPNPPYPWGTCVGGHGGESGTTGGVTGDERKTPILLESAT